jgi:hypothetical protein
MGDIRIGEETYTDVPTVSILASKWLVEIWERLGKPNSPLTASGSKLMRVIIAVWEELYPKDAKDWYKTRDEYRADEMTTKEQVHQRTGRSLASYPLQIYQMMKRLFPDFKFSDRENTIKLVRKFRMFQMANKI